MLNDELLQAQREREALSTAEGYHRYLKNQESAKANEGAYATYEAMKVIKGSIPMVSSAIVSWLEANDRKGKGRTHAAVSILKRFDPDALAYIGLNGVFTGITSTHTISKVQIHIGSVIEAEVVALDIEEERGAKVAARIKAVVAKQGSSRNKRKAFAKLASEHIEREEWLADYKARIGEPLVNAVLKALPELFELVTLTSANRSKVVVRLTEEGTALLSSIRESIAWSQPIHRPMVVKPKPWDSLYTGCYFDEKAARNVHLVRTFNKDHRKLIQQAIADGQMRFVLEAVNAIQETPWAINRKVLSVLEWAWENDISIPKFPQRQLIDLPARVSPEAWEAMGDLGRKGHRLTISGLRERNRGIVADQAVMLRDLETAKELSKFDRFYLPHNLDFRGRVYPVCHFSHQRSDHIKALFAFADAEPLGTHGAAWLAVHLANTGDFEKCSKRSFDDRLAWVASNESRILEVGRDPTGTVSFWSRADKPFSFLAACFEYTEWVDGGRSDLHLSRLPVALDGSNSGLQHYSAAMRAADEAALVSLRPSDLPSDLYQVVADQVEAAIRADASSGDPKVSTLAICCLAAGINRKLVKRNVMTFAYSSEQYGFRQQLLTDTMGPLNEAKLLGKIASQPYDQPRLDAEGNETGEMDGGFLVSGYLARHIFRAVVSVVQKATEGMTFFKQVAGALAHEGKPMIWVTPVGLPVVHRYDEWETKAVKLFLYDRAMPVTDAGPADKVEGDGSVLRQVRANIRVRPTGQIDKDKARSAVAPNVVHSMDGAHLMLTVLEAKDQGIHHFALIHDSFGTHAGRTQEFSLIIREQFAGMYANYCPFEEVLEQAKLVLQPETASRLPELPEKGDLDLEDILDALYAFA